MQLFIEKYKSKLEGRKADFLFNSQIFHGRGLD